MAASGILTLLSDFGLSDVYVGVVKGTIAQVNPRLTVIDLTHQIPPQSIAIAGFTLANAFPYFPVGTVHLAIVDPGVGSDRRAIGLALGHDRDNPTGFLVAPDNGLVSQVLDQNPVLAAVELTSRQFWRTPNPSATFHGRDIFATVSAHLASGVSLAELGTAIDPASLVRLPPLDCQIEPMERSHADSGQNSGDRSFRQSDYHDSRQLGGGQVLVRADRQRRTDQRQNLRRSTCGHSSGAGGQSWLCGDCDQRRQRPDPTSLRLGRASRSNCGRVRR